MRRQEFASHTIILKLHVIKQKTKTNSKGQTIDHWLPAGKGCGGREIQVKGVN